jgi:hypothetical protein
VGVEPFSHEREEEEKTNQERKKAYARRHETIPDSDSTARRVNRINGAAFVALPRSTMKHL